MHPLVESHRAEVEAICRGRRVGRLDVFGSAIGDRFDDTRSDLDFLVEFLPLREGEHADAYFGLLEDLEKLFERPVNLVMSRAIRNRYFRESIEKTRVGIYAA